MTHSITQPDFKTILVQDYLTALILHVEHCAHLTAVVLDALEVIRIGETPPADEIHLPQAFLLDLAAVMEIRCWEQAGIQDHIQAGLPCFADALLDLAERAETKPQEFAGPQSAVLWRQMRKFWLDRFAWCGIETLGACIISQENDDDAFAAAIADFLWANRENISRMNNAEGDQSETT